MAIDKLSRTIDAGSPSIDSQFRAFDDEDQRIDDAAQPNADDFGAIAVECQTFDDVDRAIGDEVQTIDVEDEAFDDEFQAFDVEDRAFDDEFQAIDVGFRLIGDGVPFKACLAQTNGARFVLKLGVEGSIACVEGLKDAGDRSIGVKFTTKPDAYLCFAVVDGRMGDAFPA
jgi:hypothetical protein